MVALKELQWAWPSWSKNEKLDFVGAVTSAQIADSVKILRFLIANGDPDVHSAIALAVAQCLDEKEAFSFLSAACADQPVGRRSNFLQAIALLGTSQATAFVRDQHRILWEHPELRKTSVFINWVALDCVNSLKYLLALGADKSELAEKLTFFLQHPDPRTRERAEAAFGGDA